MSSLSSEHQKDNCLFETNPREPHAPFFPSSFLKFLLQLTKNRCPYVQNSEHGFKLKHASNFVFLKG